MAKVPVADTDNSRVEGTPLAVDILQPGDAEDAPLIADQGPAEEDRSDQLAKASSGSSKRRSKPNFQLNIELAQARQSFK